MLAVVIVIVVGVGSDWLGVLMMRVVVLLISQCWRRWVLKRCIGVGCDVMVVGVC